MGLWVCSISAAFLHIYRYIRRPRLKFIPALGQIYDIKIVHGPSFTPAHVTIQTLRITQLTQPIFAYPKEFPTIYNDVKPLK